MIMIKFMMIMKTIMFLMIMTMIMMMEMMMIIIMIRSHLNSPDDDISSGRIEPTVGSLQFV